MGTPACRPKEIELPFETIGQSAGEWEPKEPGLMIIATYEDLAQIDGLVPEDDRTQLQNLNFDQYLAIAAFQGRHLYVVPGIEIQRISSKNGKIIIYAHILELVSEVRRPLKVST
jgi:hypothetical protein